ncbi:MAG: hypothetical protein E7204_03900 [Veillonella sp.]|uniref:hypothetical protein n=1 Tax=Veillonella sp. TaxID=1926307 RepID=UPI0025F2D0E3|nr:hypothetical protein [Veillonella sp.]MBE6079974.1 hypothetical protein [Veillonella sp.]
MGCSSYGAVFLFCLVCLYGLYTSQWTKVSNLAADHAGADSASGIASLDDKAGRGGAVQGQARGGFISDSVRTGGRSGTGLITGGATGKGKDAGLFVAPAISLAGVLRGRPLDDPFTHSLLNEDSTVMVGAAQTAQKGGTGNSGVGNGYGQAEAFNTPYVNGSNRGRRTNNYAAYSGNNYDRSGRAYNGDSGAESTGSYGNRRNSATAIKVTGIITGPTPMAILTSDGSEGCYGVGEGPSGVTVKQISDRAVLISSAGGSRWLYVE